MLFHNGHLSLPADTHTTLSSPQHMVIFIIDIQVKLNCGLTRITAVVLINTLMKLRRFLFHIPPAPALAADGHTGALLLQQADVGALLNVRPVSLVPL